MAPESTTGSSARPVRWRPGALGVAARRRAAVGAARASRAWLDAAAGGRGRSGDRRRGCDVSVVGPVVARRMPSWRSSARPRRPGRHRSRRGASRPPRRTGRRTGESDAGGAVADHGRRRRRAASRSIRRVGAAWRAAARRAGSRDVLDRRSAVRRGPRPRRCRVTTGAFACSRGRGRALDLDRAAADDRGAAGDHGDLRRDRAAADDGRAAAGAAAPPPAAAPEPAPPRPSSFASGRERPGPPARAPASCRCTPRSCAAVVAAAGAVAHVAPRPPAGADAAVVGRGEVERGCRSRRCRAPRPPRPGRCARGRAAT